MSKTSHSMLTLTLLLFSLLPALASTTILTADQALENQEYTTAIKIYQQLAPLGNQQAIRQLAHMYHKGLGVAPDPTQAYAWLNLVIPQSDSDVTTWQQQLMSSMSPAEQEKAQTLAAQWQQQWGQAALQKNWLPAKTSTEDAPQKTPDYRLQVISRKAPKYPVSSLRQGQQGWVRLGFFVYPDGSVRDISVVDSVPQDVFDEAAVKAVQTFRFQVDFKPGVEPHPILAYQSIQFELHTRDQDGLLTMYQSRLEQLEQQAQAGHPDAQYYYALAASSRSIISNHIDLKQISMSDWLVRAATNGQADAQYLLGQKIHHGHGFAEEPVKGINWMLLAAQSGHPKAARSLYQALSSNPTWNTTGQAPEYWLAQSAQAGDPESQLDYAHHLSHTALTSEALDEAAAYLDAYRQARKPSVKYHQTQAQWYRAQGDEKKAAKAQKKADKLAKKLGWTL